MEEQIVKLSLERYTELVKAEQKAKQYKKYFLSYSYKKPYMDILLTIEQKDLAQLNKEYLNESEEF